ncbi:TIGR03668 family PPOX class F420-dependent oxidoreductase [Nocardia sp. KC 131]|uniref:TIGR03668 family PPOX class F420-dependent oxidoreductase n=1 Tax=Nocardia arseniciresistens TaxID=3392119 RepID=UPI00398EC70C
MSPDEARKRFAASPVARLATASASGQPHIVPIVFILVGDTLYTSVDAKPKTTMALRRLANIAANPAVTVLADHYSDDWTRLWWARADGKARIAGSEEDRMAKRELTARYCDYTKQPPPGPVIAVDITRWSGWSSS